MLKPKKNVLMISILSVILIVFLVLVSYLLINRRTKTARAALTALKLSDLPSSVAKESLQKVTVTAKDGGAVMESYGGTIEFSSSDPAAHLPANYSFKNGTKEKAMSLSGWDEELRAHHYEAIATKLHDNGVANAYLGVFETVATGTQAGKLFSENSHSLAGVSSDNNYNIDDFTTAATAQGIDTYAWITINGPESTVDFDGDGQLEYTWVDPASAEHQTYINGLVTHLLTNYAGLKGVVIDYIRYADAAPTDQYRVYKDGGTFTDYTGNFAPVNATTIIAAAVQSINTVVTGFPSKELAAETYSADNQTTYDNWVTADLGQDYALMAPHLNFIIPMAYHLGYFGPDWVGRVADFVYGKVNPADPSCTVWPQVQTFEDGKGIEYPGAGEIEEAVEPIDYGKVGGLAFYVYGETSNDEWTEVRDSFDDNGVKTFDGTLASFAFGSTGTYSLTVEDVSSGLPDTQSDITIFEGHGNGSLLKTADSLSVYFIQNGKKSNVPSTAVYESRFKWPEIVTVNGSELNAYPTDGAEPILKFREGSLIRFYTSPKVYLVSDGTKRHIDTATTFTKFGFNWDSIFVTGNQDSMDALPDGATFTSSSNLPDGTLMHVTGDPKMFLIEGGKKRYIPSASVFSSAFRWEDHLEVIQATLDSYPLGKELFFREGVVVKDNSNSIYYYIEKNHKRPFYSEMFRTGLGYYWDGYLGIGTQRVRDFQPTSYSMYLLPKYIDVVGDTQDMPDIQQQIGNLMIANKPYLILHSGDVVDTCSSSSAWAAFDSYFGYLRLNSRFYSAVGNHDVSCANFQSRFGTDKWYSHDIDNIHLIFLDGNTSLASGGAQYTWLHGDLDAQPVATRFTLVVFHQPPYTLGGLPDAVALFETHGVDAVFNGHIHCYERAIKTSITYTINGRGGAEPLINPCHNDGDTQHYESSFGYVRLLLNNNKLELRAFDQNGNQVDSADLSGI